MLYLKKLVPVLLFLAMLLIPVSSVYAADSTTVLRDQIAALMARLTQLQAQLSQQVDVSDSGGVSTANSVSGTTIALDHISLPHIYVRYTDVSKNAEISLKNVDSGMHIAHYDLRSGGSGTADMRVDASGVSTGTYVLVLTGGSGGVLATTPSFKLTGTAPVCETYVSDKMPEPNESVTVSWKSTGATSATADFYSTPQNPKARTIATSGSRTVRVSVPTVYSFWFEGPGGRATCTALIDVRVNEDDEDEDTGIAVEAVGTSQSVTIETPISSSYGRFVIKYDVTALDSDIYIPQNASVQKGVGATYVVLGDPSFKGSSNASLTSTADLSNGYFLVDEGDSESFYLTVTLDPNSTGSYRVGLTQVGYATSRKTPDSTKTIDTDDRDFQTKAITIPDSETTTSTTVQVSDPQDGARYVAGSGDSFLVNWFARGVPSGATACTSLTQQATGKMFAFPGAGSCSPAKNGVDAHMGTFIRTSGYDLGPGTYKVGVRILGQSAGGKDGPTLAESLSRKVITLVEKQESTLNTYRGYLNGKLFIETKNISESAALENCKLNATNNPSAVVRCTWGDREIYRREVVVTTSPPTCAISSNKYMVQANESFTITWSGNNADYAVSKSGMKVGVSGSETVSTPVAGVYNYPVTFHGAGGTKTCSARVVVNDGPVAPPVPPPAVFFSASNVRILAGQSSVLSWTSSGANKCFLQGNGTEGYVDLKGSRSVTPTKTTTYRLICSNDPGTGKDGPATEKNVTITVDALSTAGTIDARSLIATTAYPVLTGTAKNVSTVGISIDNGEKVFGSGDISVVNGTWSVKVTSALASGKYNVNLSTYNSTYRRSDTLATGTLVVEAPVIDPKPPTVKDIQASALTGADSALAALAEQLKALVERLRALKGN